MKTRKHAITVLRGLTLAAAVILAFAPALWADSPKVAVPTPPSMATVRSAYGKLPLSFEANQGQWDTSVQFVMRGRGHTLFLTPSDAVLTLKTEETKSEERSTSSHSVVRMKFNGADPQAEIGGLDLLPGIVNYFIGDDPSKRRKNIPTYQKVGYKDLYPGIDLVYYGNQGRLEYDLIVAPCADPAQIILAFDGAEQIAVDEQGDLVLTLPRSSAETAEGAAPTLRLHKPVVYQRDEQGEKHLLAGSYVLRDSQNTAGLPRVALHQSEAPHVAFQVASYDASRPLIIDPVLSWATYLGGSDTAYGGAIAVDAAGNAYVTFLGGGFPGYASVMKLNAAGTAILYSTNLGGSNITSGKGIAVDQTGHAYVTGWTMSPDFPGTAGSPIQSMLNGGSDAFVAKLNEAGTAILYSTYLGGSGGDSGNEIAVDATGQAYVTGDTGSSGFPGTLSSLIQSTFGGGVDAFVTKINEAGTALLYSTYLGGSSGDVALGIAVDAADNAYVTGHTQSSDFPGTAGSPVQSGYGGGEIDAFITKLNAAGTSIVCSTYLGGSGGDVGEAIAVDQSGQAYVTGSTGSSAFPGTSSSLIQSTFGGDADAFITKLNAAGTAILHSTYLGGSLMDFGEGIAVDAVGQAYVTGETFSSNFPGTAGSPIQSTLLAQTNGFVARITSTPPPICSAAKAVPAVLWSPNHQLAPIAVTGVTDPEGHAVTIAVTGVTQDEPVNAKGDGNTSPDAVIQAGAALVRAERSGKGNGRVYELSFKADDGQGGVCSGTVRVSVPHSLQKGATAIDDGQIYDSTIP